MVMRKPVDVECCAARLVYRLVVEGEVGAEWTTWFGDAAIVAANGRTTMELDVADQAELHGLLRRVHDLNLKIVALLRQDVLKQNGHSDA
jgi:hypothetical protein